MIIVSICGIFAKKVLKRLRTNPADDETISQK